MHLVSLACPNTEIVWAVDWLVGVDGHPDFPPGMACLPR